jgi:hypothetical protein
MLSVLFNIIIGSLLLENVCSSASIQVQCKSYQGRTSVAADLFVDPVICTVVPYLPIRVVSWLYPSPIGQLITFPTYIFQLAAIAPSPERMLIVVRR